MRVEVIGKGVAKSMYSSFVMVVQVAFVRWLTREEREARPEETARPDEPAVFGRGLPVGGL